MLMESEIVEAVSKVNYTLLEEEKVSVDHLLEVKSNSIQVAVFFLGIKIYSDDDECELYGQEVDGVDMFVPYLFDQMRVVLEGMQQDFNFLIDN